MFHPAELPRRISLKSWGKPKEKRKTRGTAGTATCIFFEAHFCRFFFAASYLQWMYKSRENYMSVESFPLRKILSVEWGRFSHCSLKHITFYRIPGEAVQPRNLRCLDDRPPLSK